LNISRLGFLAFAVLLGGCAVAFGTATKPQGLIAAAVGLVLGLPLAIFYGVPATRSQAARGARASDRIVAVLASTVGIALVPAVASALGMIDWVLVGAAATASAIAMALLYTALDPSTMEAVEAARRLRGSARNRRSH
jgi:hypothetical protein